MKHIYIALMLLFLSSLSCTLPFQNTEQKDFYFVEYFPDGPRLIQFVNKNEIYDLTPSKAEEITGASLSPSKRYIAYSLGLTNGIYVMNVETLESTQITDFGYHPDWSSDEKWLTFEFQENNHTTGSDITKDRVYAVNIENRTIYTPNRLADNYSVAASWSPKTSSIVYTSNTQENVSQQTGKKGLYSYSTIEQEGNFILESNEYNYQNPFISPDGQFILYTIIDGSDRSLVLSQFDSELDKHTVISGPDQYFGLPQWSQDSEFFILDAFIYDNVGNRITEIKMDNWYTGQIVWGNSNNQIFLCRYKDPIVSTVTQLVSYNMRTRKLDVLYGTTNTVYLLPYK
jgi:dipeptidyl aminopeptidase/acylaminoacyl peptidase